MEKLPNSSLGRITLTLEGNDPRGLLVVLVADSRIKCASLVKEHDKLGAGT